MSVTVDTYPDCRHPKLVSIFTYEPIPCQLCQNERLRTVLAQIETHAKAQCTCAPRDGVGGCLTKIAELTEKAKAVR